MGQDRRRQAAPARSAARLNTATADRGREAETAACGFLERHGLVLMARNYRSRGGEIDLVMRDGETVVFVEVRSRRGTGFMHPAESIDGRKRGRLISAGRRFLQEHGLCNSAACRFDAVFVIGAAKQRKIEWLKGAFEA